jgi:HlyD family secretion protein
MWRDEDDGHLDGPAHRWASGPHGEGLGPQGAALILELQRLRHAFEGEDLSGPPAARPPRHARERSQPERRSRPRQQKRPKKSKMARAIDACLEQFGFKGSVFVERGAEAPEEPASPPPRRISPNLAPDQPLPMQLIRPAAEITGRNNPQPSMLLENPRLELPRLAETGPSVGELIEKGRAALKAGVAFIIEPGKAPPPTGADTLTARIGWTFKNELRTGLRVLIIVAVLAGGWLALMPLAGAVVVPGNLVVQSNVKAIQHPTGGVVADIKVYNGMRVAAGDLLVRLDATQTQANLQMISKQLDELRARIARLVAERDGQDRPEIPAALTGRSNEDSVRMVLTSEQSLFKARFTARKSQKDLLQSRVSQLTEEISGLDAQIASKAKQLELIAGELSGVQDLYDKRLVPMTRLTTLQRETARIEGERGQLVSAIAETKSKIGEAQLQIVRIDQDFRTDVVKELGETQGKEAELSERAVAARDQLERIEMRAPTSGVIHQMSIHTIGGVVRAGDTLMEIVPDTDDLQIEARLQPNDIDQVRSGQKAFVRFSAFNQRLTPQLTGTVAYVSADTSHDQQTNAPYFTVRVVLSEEEVHRLGALQLVPGMPAEVFMQTGSRTMMSYLLKPITEQMQRAFVER